MPCLQVRTETCLSGTGVVAVRALVGLGAIVGIHVLPQVARVVSLVVALRALKALGTRRVGEQMAIQSRLPSALVVAVRTTKRLLAAVHEKMLSQSSLINESFVSFGALVRAIIGVS